MDRLLLAHISRKLQKVAEKIVHRMFVPSKRMLNMSSSRETDELEAF